MKEIQTKYEDQLPKIQKLTFDKIFGYITGLASLAGLIGAPFIIKDLSTLNYVYMSFLSLLVLLLLVHALLIEKRKLHRYAQTIFHIHFVQHIIRNSLASSSKGDFEDDIKDVTQKILNSVAYCFSFTSGKNCRATIIELKSNFELEVVARDDLSEIKAKSRTKKHKLEDNTDFENLWYAINGCSRYYLNNNIIRSWLNHKYKNSSLLEEGEPETKSIFGFSYVKNWPLSYRSVLILPIRYISKFSPPNETQTVANWDYYGFLCIDSISKNSFDERYSPELGAIFADMLYTYYNQKDFILDSLTNPNQKP